MHPTTATATMALGASESTEHSNRVYVNLRTGKISEVSKNENESRPGFKPFTTENKSGTKYHFFAKTYDDLRGFISNILWNEHTLPDGTRLAGWNVFINTGDKEFVLQIQTNDRPYQTLMSVLPNVDFNLPVRIVAFMGKDKKDKPQKVLLLTQNPDPTAKDWIKPKYYAKWLTRLVAKKVKEGVALTDDEAAHVAYTADGKPDPNFPYIREKNDGSWSLDAWNEFLFDKMESEVIPAVQDAQIRRDEMKAAEFLLSDDEDGSNYENSFETDDDDENGGDEIPF